MTNDEQALIKGRVAEELAELRGRWGCLVSQAERYLDELEKARRILERISGRGIQINGGLPPEKEWPVEEDWPGSQLWALFRDSTDTAARIAKLEDRFRDWRVFPAES